MVRRERRTEARHWIRNTGIGGTDRREEDQRRIATMTGLVASPLRGRQGFPEPYVQRKVGSETWVNKKARIET